MKGSIVVKRLYNKRVAIPYPRIRARELLDYLSQEFTKQTCDNEEVLRWAIVNATDTQLFVEKVIAEMHEPIDKYEPLDVQSHSSIPAVVFILPTGVRASFGGYIGDITPAVNLVATTTDYLITNPNAVNAAMVNYAAQNVLYTEGFILDQFFAKRIALEPISGRNRIGLIVDKTATQNDQVFNLICNTADTCRIAGGMQIVSYAITKKCVGGESFQTQSGAFSGTIKNPHTLLAGAETLLEASKKNIDTIAITTHIRIPKNALTLYHQGKIPDPHGGLEAVISHFLSWHTKKMVAHAPVLLRQEIEKMLFSMKTVDPRAAGEIVGAAGFLGCVFSGLSRAPRIHWLPDKQSGQRISLPQNALMLNNIIAIVTPYNALGGFPMLVAAKEGIPIIAVRENETLLKVSKDTLHYGTSVVEVDNYYQAAALVRSLPIRNNLHLCENDLFDLDMQGRRIAEHAGIHFSGLERPVQPFKEWARIE